MRFGLVVFVMLSAFGVASAQDGTPGAQPPADAGAEPSGVTVNFDALPTAPPPKPKVVPPAHPLSLARPRPKPELSAAAPEAPARVEGTLVVPATDKPVVAAAPAKPAPHPPVAMATPPTTPQVPVTIVSTNTKAFPVEISGVAADPFAGAKTVNPLAGFSVMSRVRFVNGRSEITAQAQAVLDDLAARLMTSQVRVRLAAFSGRAGDLSSDARRLSLARALAIRAYLTAKGVAAERVDVLAFGGATDGIIDRVDVLVRGT